MSTSKFDRVRPRTPAADPASAPLADVEGKRALFSATDPARPVGGSIRIDCSRCGQTTTLTPAAALRAAFPALHLSVGIGHGDRETSVGLWRRRRFGSWLRCPACGHGSWVRVTLKF